MQKIIRCQVKQILDHGGQLYSLFLEPESPAPTFLPGQYLSLALDGYSPGAFGRKAAHFPLPAPRLSSASCASPMPSRVIFPPGWQRSCTRGPRYGSRCPWANLP